MDTESVTTPATRTPHRARRILGVLALTAAFTVLAGGVAAAQSVNPYDGVSPDITLFGPALNQTWKRLLAAIWGASLALAGLWVLTSFLSSRKARKRGMSSDLSEAGEDLKLSLIILGGVAAVSPIVGAVLLLVQPGSA
ncbi:MAG: hypothetical protein U5N21_14905 [Rhodococcus sp. (in: high G+C Gram-positive bacteria)]|uniref:hypothetical protein n=1 Tax=Rhodococcus sp. TaxID=1831 RepID=UPI002ACD915D|nr:hypothetical protein [Mycobacterium sp.]MDZ7914826.1 hypothetical protein [Rhodococcus sp. (in: high G+C Gram-positive bacteria)]MDZ7931176.1 hypothetical protein [Rhodococcus sp. (in: high G+C Gram-positive bacteria)]MDZ7931261.1 hypothetical protein [Rhodococcus sp. (in: high G+C Gram-positive bacteria)]